MKIVEQTIIYMKCAWYWQVIHGNHQGIFLEHDARLIKYEEIKNKRFNSCI